MSLSGDKGVAQFKKSVKMGHPIVHLKVMEATGQRRRWEGGSDQLEMEQHSNKTRVLERSSFQSQVL